MNPWDGKHMWIWQLDRAGNQQEIVNRSLEMGLSGILVKAWDGGNYWKQIESIIGPAKAAGLVVGAWGYSYGTNPQGEGQVAQRAVNAGVDWLVVDAEAEYEKSSGAQMANSLGNVFRSLFQVPIGYTSFGIAQYHAKFPFKQFSSWCNVVLPQVYWGDFNMPVTKALQLSYDGLRPFGLPIAPVGQSYSLVTPADITRFGELAINYGFPGISYWSWQHATPAMFEAIAKASYKKEENTVSDWAKESWDKAIAKGIFDGNNPQGAVTREMLAVIIDRLGLLDDAPIPQEMVNKLKDQGLIANDHHSGARITWGEFSTVMDRLLKKIK